MEDEFFMDLNTSYDLKSIMQYNSYAFAIPEDKLTIVSKSEPQIIPKNIQLSAIDIKEIRMLYNCESNCDLKDSYIYLKISI